MGRGVGVAHGAVSVLNAIPTGLGGAIGIDLPVRAEVRLLSRPVFSARSVARGRSVRVDVKVLEAVLDVVGKYTGFEGGFEAEISSEIPVAAGLKSSHALINSLIASLLDALGEHVEMEELALMGVEASKKAGLTITGAYDDSLATLGQGVYITDNKSLRILEQYRVDEELYAVVLVPPWGNPIRDVDASKFRLLRERYMEAARLALEGDWARAMTLNGFLTAAAMGSDLGVLARALNLPGVLSAGMSGKGPALFALTRTPEPVAELWGSLGGEIITVRVLGG